MCVCLEIVWEFYLKCACRNLVKMCVEIALEICVNKLCWLTIVHLKQIVAL